MIETVEMVELELDFGSRLEDGKCRNEVIRYTGHLRYTYGLYLKYYELFCLSLQYYGRNRHK